MKKLFLKNIILGNDLFFANLHCWHRSAKHQIITARVFQYVSGQPHKINCKEQLLKYSHIRALT